MTDRRRLRYATEGFLAQMRKEHLKANPGAVVPAWTLGDFPAAGQDALINAVAAAVVLMESRHDAHFVNWCALQDQKIPPETP